MPVESSSIVCQCTEDMAVSDMNGEVVMMTMSKGDFYNLDDISSRIWSLIENPRTVADVCAELQTIYDVDAQTCEQDVLALLNDLADKGLIKIVTASA